MSTPIFYDARQNVDGLDSFSPSAGKPQRFVDCMAHWRYHDFGPHNRGPVTPVTMDDLHRVHSQEYVDGVFSGVILNGFENRDQRVPESCLWTAGSLLSAARHAMKYPETPVCSPTSGFHHAGHGWGGGYCTFNGLMVTAAKLIDEGLKVAILDCDHHYGDGTADILGHDTDLAKSVMHFTAGKYFHGDDPQGEAMEFVIWLNEAIACINAFNPNVVLYQAGADPHIKDPLGGFLDSDGIKLRDRAVFRSIRAPIAWNLAGGYQKGKDQHFLSDPVLDIHRATVYESDNSYDARVELRKSK